MGGRRTPHITLDDMTGALRVSEDTTARIFDSLYDTMAAEHSINNANHEASEAQFGIVFVELHRLQAEAIARDKAAIARTRWANVRADGREAVAWAQYNALLESGQRDRIEAALRSQAMTEDAIVRDAAASMERNRLATTTLQKISGLERSVIGMEGRVWNMEQVRDGDKAQLRSTATPVKAILVSGSAAAGEPEREPPDVPVGRQRAGQHDRL